VAAVKETKPRFVGLSALLTSTMTKMEAVLERLAAEGLRDSVSVVVGGAPVSAAFAERIGADAYCRDAFDAVDTLERLQTETT
jgi:5-methyltetrahydrofolate--homocysteine methyltransferase